MVVGVEIEKKVAEKIKSNALEKELDMEIFEGTLLDNCVIENFRDGDAQIVLNGKKAQFIIIREKFINHWNSGYELVLTDDEKFVEDFRSQFAENDEDAEDLKVGE